MQLGTSGAPTASTTATGSAVLALLGKNGQTNSQTFGNAINFAKDNSLVIDSNGGTVNLTLGTITNTLGGTLAVTTPASGSITIAAGNTVSTGGLLVDVNANPYVIVNGVDWGAKNGTNNLVGGSSVGGFYTANAPTALTAASNADMTTAATLAANTSVASLRFNTASALTLDLGGNSLVTGGILMGTGAGANDQTISNGSLQGTQLAAVGKNLAIYQANTSANLIINSIIANNGAATTTPATALSKAGPGTLVLSGTNTYTGVTYFNGGTISVGTIANGTIAQPLGASTNVAANWVFNGGSLRYTGATASTDHGATFLGISAIDVTQSGANLTIGSGSIGTAGLANTPGILRKLGAGTLTLAGTGANANLSIEVVAGTLNLAKTGTAVAVQQANGAALIIGNTATARITGASTGMIDASSSVVVKTGGTFDLNGFNSSFDGLAGSGTVTSATGTPTLRLGSGNGIAISAYTIGAAAAGVGSTGLNNFSGSIGGTIALNKIGAGTQILSGSTNTYGGGTTVTAGTLQMGVANAVPTSTDVTIIGNTAVNGLIVPGNFDLGGFNQSIDQLSSTTGGFVTNTPTLVGISAGVYQAAGLSSGTATRSLTIGAGNGSSSFNGVLQDGLTIVPGTTPTSVIGALALIKNGTGTQTFLGASTFTGGTTINAGSILIGRSNGTFNGLTTGSLGSGTVLIGDTTGSADAALLIDGAFSFGNAVTTQAGNTGTSSIGGNADAVATFSGAITLNNNLTISQVGTTGGNGLNVTGGIASDSIGQKTVTFAGPGKINVNTTGISDGPSGSVAVQVSVGTTQISAASTYSGNTTVSGGVLQLGAANVLPSGTAKGNLSVSGTLDLNGFNQTVNGLSGAGTIDNTAGSTTAVLTAGANDQTSSFSGVIQNSGSGATVGLTKTGSGTLTLSNANTYTGPTNVNGGVLNVTGSLSTTGVTVASGGTLGGNGTLAGTVGVQTGGILAAGNGGVGTINVAGLTASVGSIFNFEFNGGLNDLVNISGTNGLTLNGGGVNLFLEGTNTAFSTNGTYNLFQYLGSIGGAGFNALSVLNAAGGKLYTFGSASGFVTLTISSNSGNFWAPNAAGGSGPTSTWSAGSTTWAETAGVLGTNPQGSSGALIFTDVAGTVTVSGTVGTADGLTFSSNGYLLTGGTINLTGSTSSNALTVGSGLTAEIASTLNVTNGMTKAGAGTLILSGANTVANTVVSAGLLNVTGSLTAGSNLTVGASGTATFAGVQSLGTVQADGTVNFNGATAAVTTLNGVIGGTVNVGSGTVLTVSDGTFAGSLTGGATSGLVKTSAGTLFLSGNNAGFTGSTTVDAGTLDVATALGGTVTVNGGNFTGAGAGGSNVTVNSGGTQTVEGTQSGTTNLAGGTLDVSGTGILAGTTTVSSGTLNVQSGGLVSGTLTQSAGNINVLNGGSVTGQAIINGGIFTVQNGGSLTNAVGGGIDVNVGGQLIVNNGGTISGTGQTNVGGTLVANGDVQGLVVVENGGTVQGTGSIGGVNVQAGGTLSVGNSVGTLTLDGNGMPGNAPALTLNVGSNLVFEFNNATGVAGGAGIGGWDYIELGGGMLTINATNQSPNDHVLVHIDSLNLLNNHGPAANFNAAAGVAGNIQEYYWKFIGLNDLSQIVYGGPSSIGGRFQVIDDAFGAGVFDVADNNPFNRPSSSIGQGTFKVLSGDFGQGNGLYIYYSAVPEPGSMLLGTLAALGAGWYGRRRNRQKADADAAVAADLAKND